MLLRQGFKSALKGSEETQNGFERTERGVDAGTTALGLASTKRIRKQAFHFDH